VELIFISTVLVGTLFRDGGIVLWQWGWLSVTSEGLVILASVFLKASLSLAMLNLLVLTTAVPDLFQALVALRIPRLLVAILAAMYRYTEVLIAEFNTMKRAATARNLMTRSRWQRLVIGHMIGALFIRTYDRGVRIHQAMLARGYTGIPAIPDSSKVTKTDWVFVLFFLLVLLAGQLVYLFTASGLF
jgi:cobalt/nickel transport system permease protein